MAWAFTLSNDWTAWASHLYAYLRHRHRMKYLDIHPPLYGPITSEGYISCSLASVLFCLPRLSILNKTTFQQTHTQEHSPSTPRKPTMCHVASYKSSECKCKWMSVIQPCGPNAGFSLCEKFGDGRIKRSPEVYESNQCPIHVLYGQYDRNYTRMIVKETTGWRIGAGPNKTDPGVDVKCVVM